MLLKGRFFHSRDTLQCLETFCLVTTKGQWPSSISGIWWDQVRHADRCPLMVAPTNKELSSL